MMLPKRAWCITRVDKTEPEHLSLLDFTTKLLSVPHPIQLNVKNMVVREWTLSVLVVAHRRAGERLGEALVCLNGTNYLHYVSRLLLSSHGARHSLCS